MGLCTLFGVCIEAFLRLAAGKLILTKTACDISCDILYLPTVPAAAAREIALLLQLLSITETEGQVNQILLLPIADSDMNFSKHHHAHVIHALFTFYRKCHTIQAQWELLTSRFILSFFAVPFSTTFCSRKRCIAP